MAIPRPRGRSRSVCSGDRVESTTSERRYLQGREQGAQGERGLRTHKARGRGRRDSRRLIVVAAIVFAAGAGLCGDVGFSGAMAMTVGNTHTCVVTEDGNVKCWGSNAYGQLGQPYYYDSIGGNATEMGDNLLTVPLGTNFHVSTVVAGGDFSCALSDEGEVKCWGSNSYGELGLEDSDQRGGGNTTENSLEMENNLPTVDVGTNVSVESLGLGLHHSCAVITGGSLKCWGRNNGGQLGLGHTKNIGSESMQMGDYLEEVDLGTGVSASSVALGTDHTCALVDNGGVKCWGNNNGGQLGYEDMDDRGSGPNEMGENLTLVDLGREQKALAISAGAYFTCALLYTGGVKCWGFGSSGQLGQGNNNSIGAMPDTMGDYLPTIDLGTGREVLALTAGAVHACSVLDDETVKCWGGNTNGNLGLGDIVNRGILAGEMGDNLPAVNLTFGDGGGNVSNAAAGSMYHTCVSGTLGGMTCFGANSNGQLGAGLPFDENVGDDPDEVQELDEIDLGTNVTAVFLTAPGEGFDFVTISPTPAPTMPPTLSPTPTPTLAPTASPTESTRKPVISPSPVDPSADQDRSPVDEKESADDGNSGNSMIGIVLAAIFIPIVALVAIFCCWRRRERARQIGKASATITGRGFRDTDCEMRRGYSPEDGTPTDEHGDLEEGEGARPHDLPVATKAATPEAQAFRDAFTPSAPMDGDGVVFPTATPLEGASSSARTIDISVEGLESQHATATAIPTATATPAGAPRAASAGTASDDDDSWGARSEAENPGALRRSGSNSSISTLDSTSTASSTWPGSVGFMTPARTDISRGMGRPSGRGRSHASSASGTSDSFSAGLRTPASHAGATPGRAEPDTPSPRSGSGSVYGTPHPPEMRLAQFARASTGGNALHGLPEMEVGRSPSASIAECGTGGCDSGNNTPLTASTIAAAAAAAAGGFGPSSRGGAISPEDVASPTMLPTLTPARVRHPGGGDDEYHASRRISARKSIRSTGTASSPGTSGRLGEPDAVGGAIGAAVGGRGGLSMGPEAAAQAFTEEAELEALQIDKNDLKLVFGRPFARGKSSEVYQVTHEGRNRAAKIIDLFSLGVIGEEVTRLYACFAQELRAMKGIRHDCVAVVYGAVATPSELTIVTDLVKRGALRAVLDDKGRSESLKPHTRHRIMKDVAAGMAYLSEQGIEHRNLHSHNVLITKEWGAKVADYGLSRTTGVMVGAHDRSQAKGKKRGRASYRSSTLRWTAPELLKPPVEGSDPFTEASDVYSLGVIVWEMLCGGPKLPYDGVAEDKVKSMILEGSTPPVSMETPLVYSKLMLLCWRKNPSSRPTFSHIDTVLLKDPPQQSSS